MLKRLLLLILIAVGCKDQTEVKSLDHSFIKFPHVENLSQVRSNEMLDSHFTVMSIGKDDKIYDVIDIINRRGEGTPYEMVRGLTTEYWRPKLNFVDGPVQVLIDVNSTVRDRWFGNMPHNLTLNEQDKWFISAFENEKPVESYPVYILNGSNNQVLIQGDIEPYLIQEAKDESGSWKPIEYVPMGIGCANGVTSYMLKPTYYLVGKVYKYSGDYKTELRLKLKNGNFTTYSNIFRGSINKEQFSPPAHCKEENFLN